MLTLKKTKKVIISLFYIFFLIIIINISCDTADQYLGVNNSLLSDSSDEDDSSSGASSNGGGSSFSPSDIGGLTLWLDAIQITGLNDGDQVSTWADQSGNSYDLTQAGGNRPTYETNELNGNPVVCFTAGNRYLDRSDCLGISGNPGLTIFIVANITDAAGTDRLFQIGKSSNPTAGAIISFGEDGAHRYNNGNSVPIADYSATYSIGTFRNSNGATYAPREFFQNSVLSGDGTLGGLESYSSQTSTPNIPASSTRTTVGCGFNGTGTLSSYSTCNIAEIIVYNTELSDTERQQVEDYLSSKWGI